MSSRSTATEGRRLTTVSASALELGEEVEDLQVQPDQGDEQPKGAHPLHVLRGAELRAALDEVEVEHEVQGRDHHHEDAEGDADGPAVVDVGNADAEEPQAHRHEVQEGDGPRG